MDLYARIRDKLFPHMRREACAWVSRHFETFLGQVSNFGYVPVLKHGDFGPSNILFNGHKRELAGVIDFSGAGMGDPAYDFAGLLSGYGENFVKLCTHFYPNLDQFYDRVLYYQGTFALLEALFGIENNDLEAFEAGIGMYR
jgi:aminoglycoside 2''-phosphotransferase